jgi:hypothetical protein
MITLIASALFAVTPQGVVTKVSPIELDAIHLDMAERNSPDNRFECRSIQISLPPGSFEKAQVNANKLTITGLNYSRTRSKNLPGVIVSWQKGSGNKRGERVSLMNAFHGETVVVTNSRGWEKKTLEDASAKMASSTS